MSVIILPEILGGALFQEHGDGNRARLDGWVHTTDNSTVVLQYIINCVYDPGIKYYVLLKYIYKNINTLALAWNEIYVPKASAEFLNETFTRDEQRQIAILVKTIQVFARVTYFPTINQVHLCASPSSMVLGPSELGLVYAQIFKFYEFNFAADLHASLITKLLLSLFLLYLSSFSLISFFKLSLVYALLKLEFQLHVSSAYEQGSISIVLSMTLFRFFNDTGCAMEHFGTLIWFPSKSSGLLPDEFP